MIDVFANQCHDVSSVKPAEKKLLHFLQGKRSLKFVCPQFDENEATGREKWSNKYKSPPSLLGT